MGRPNAIDPKGRSDIDMLNEASRQGYNCTTQAVIIWSRFDGGFDRLGGKIWPGPAALDYDEVFANAVKMGWTPPRWWKPWRWGDYDARKGLSGAAK